MIRQDLLRKSQNGHLKLLVSFREDEGHDRLSKSTVCRKTGQRHHPNLNMPNHPQASVHFSSKISFHEQTETWLPVGKDQHAETYLAGISSRMHPSGDDLGDDRAVTM
jgi:hypothetical protein